MSLGAIGIGLGGFMDGYQASRKNRLDEERSTALLDRQKKLDARQDVENARQDAQYARDEGQRTAIADIGAETKKNFDDQVKAGTQQAGDFDTFWSKYAVPKLQQTYLASGDIGAAKRVQEWGDSTDAKAGGKLAMGALLKAQTGDADGALADVMEAGKLQGYINHGYEVLGHENIAAPDGSIAGYRIRLKTPSGEPVEQDIQKADLPRMIATFMNPEAAWQSQETARGAAAKDAKDLETYEAKKKIDKQYGTGENKTRGDAITALRKRMDGGLADNEQKFDDLPRPDQEKMIAQEIELQSGQPGLSAEPSQGAAPSGPPRRVLVDKVTGRPVSEAPPAPQPQQTPSTQQPAPKPSREDNVQYLLQSADQAIKSGESPERIAQELLNNGVPQEQWPESLATALSVSKQNQIGIGR
ncbi:hypothetical protein ASC97_05640 [Rhizobium sp. Root1203]|uniref:hypothetical protein n=1 Tax=Rhizobium sp. Root1203 TaxID=1736427 RepID=UPI00070995B3|nr:hypothetical protein [Rhizobium sp. Root1203]KQV27847.1 hypothetical protein ASC97_05640 [Rhizobium sp. Root1203]